MRIIADLHIHSKYSRATSKNMDLKDISYYGSIKGLNLIGTGDFTHPKWFNELSEHLEEVNQSGIFKLQHDTRDVVFLLSTEVSTVFKQKDDIKKIHHVILTPNKECASQLNDRFKKYGRLDIDGRPTLHCSAPELVEIVTEVCDNNFIFPAHIWTPWFSLFGSKNNYNTILDCYQDQAKKIYAVETGLSSDPPMNWRINELNQYTLLSNSDAHSAWPWRLGREANVFETTQLTYSSLINIIKDKNQDYFKYTIETPPQYGKYHWTGHRSCNVSMPPRESIKNSGICPRCGKQMVKGVEERVEELADHLPGFRSTNAINYISLLPLSEIIAEIFQVGTPSSKMVWNLYNLLISKFGSEFNVLLDADLTEISSLSNRGRMLSKVIEDMRNGRLTIDPGYDGVYGRILLDSSQTKRTRTSKKGLWRFM